MRLYQRTIFTGSIIQLYSIRNLNQDYIRNQGYFTFEARVMNTSADLYEIIKVYKKHNPLRKSLYIELYSGFGFAVTALLINVIMIAITFAFIDSNQIIKGCRTMWWEKALLEVWIITTFEYCSDVCLNFRTGILKTWNENKSDHLWA